MSGLSRHLGQHRSLRIALVKPDWGVRGGAEVVIDRMEEALAGDGHRLSRRLIPIPRLPRQAFGVPVPAHVWDQAPEYFRYLATIDAVEAIDVSDADLVISTQPPSWAAEHPRHLSVFFHHLRVFYDLEELYLKAGLAGPPELHAAARQKVRTLDQPRMEAVTWFCANSEVTAARLEAFNGLTNSSVHHAGIGVGTEHSPTATAAPGRGAVLCVSRSEFTKRTELFVHAMKYLPQRRAVLVGSGGRLPWVQAIDRRLSTDGVDLDAVTDSDLWLNGGEAPVDPGRRGRDERSNVAFAGRVSDKALVDLYRVAPCVVAPAYGEDYGLTALEAMARGRPVVVLSDGGGLTGFVRDGVNGFVAEPTGRAIAAAVARITSDDDLARRMGQAALATAADYSWARCATELRSAVERVLDG